MGRQMRDRIRALNVAVCHDGFGNALATRVSSVQLNVEHSHSYLVRNAGDDVENRQSVQSITSIGGVTFHELRRPLVW